MSCSPAFLRSGLKEVARRFWKSKGLPPMMQKTRPLSCHRLPIPRRSAFWSALCDLRDSTARRVSRSCRPLPFLGAVKVGSVLARDLVRLTRRVSASRSMSSHLRPSSSPILKPAVTASTWSASRRFPRAASKDKVSTYHGFVTLRIKGAAQRESVGRFAEAAGEIKAYLRIGNNLRTMGHLSYLHSSFLRSGSES